jgi:peptide/nickel transport system ATP-binding protein
LVPNLIGQIEGCAFRNRCPHAFHACATTEVALSEMRGGHGYRCLLSPQASTANAAAAAAVA